MEKPCPHCNQSIPVPPESWQFLPPWQCSHCAGLFGVGESGLFRIPAEIKPLWPLFSWLEAKRFGFHSHGKHYVYALCYPSGLPFYVGKGQNARACQHAEETWTLSKSRWSEKHGVIISLADRNEAEWYHFLALVDSDRRAAAIEAKFINRWGVRSAGGLLTNRVVPTEQPRVDALEVNPPSAIRAVVSDRSPRMVHHPSLLIGGGIGKTIDLNCGICSEKVLVPNDLLVKVVQCPQCAHFFKPMFPQYRRAGIIEFGSEDDEKITSSATCADRMPAPTSPARTNCQGGDAAKSGCGFDDADG
jgi:hypothetical protein